MADLYAPTHPVRFVTAASLFDGHDAAINIMRRILQRQGAEVIHLGHDRSVDDVVSAAVEEGLARTDYGAVLASRGITTVALDEDGQIVEHRPDGTESVVGAVHALRQ